MITDDIKRFRLYSDLHLEFAECTIPEMENENECLLILAGDISVGTKHLNIFKELQYRFPHIIYVLGNHEFYHGDIYLTEKEIKQWFDDEHILNVSVVGNNAELIEFNDFRVIAGTLWTDMNDGDPLTMNVVSKSLNDYFLIKNDKRTLNATDTTDICMMTQTIFSQWLSQPYAGKTIVVTHHMPSFDLVDEQYKLQKGAREVNAGFASDLNYLVDMFVPDYWCYGHTHTSTDSMMGKTRMLCNPRGYPNRFSMFSERPVFENSSFIENFEILL
jgi:predicted phosphodiesterase